jgi:cholesterol transport system auxiliary component
MKPLFPLPPFRASFRRVPCAAALVALAAVLASCALSQPAPPKRMFLLEPVMPAAVAAPRAAVLRAGTVNVAAPFRGKGFVYREGEFRYEADYYDEFFIAPAAMLTDTTAKAMASANVFRQIIAAGARSDEGDYVLDGFVSELFADARDRAAPAAVLAVTFYLSTADPLNLRVLWSREYRQRIVFSGTDPEALVRAWNAAWSTTYADLARDLAAADLPKK